ncbi:TolC family protein [Niveibacterium sp. SC-1]|uniref:TolC family protein n=1 Tax=Niveibacterium sp. SC-1 TaxID=3135646 RepID=UPI00311E33D5
MYQRSFLRPRLLALAAASLAASAPTWALNLDQALDAALARAPELNASTAATSAARALTQSAGALPDPRLAVWVDDLPTSGDEAYRVDRSKRMVSLMQEVPSGARREAERRIAEARLQGSEAQARNARISVRRETTLAWLGLHFLARKSEVLDAQHAEVQRSEAASLAAIKGGGAPAAALLARLERNQLDDAQDELRRDTARARAELARWTGEDAAREPASGSLPVWLTQPSPADEDLERQPEVHLASTQLSEAQSELSLSEAGRSPDWSVELGAGQDAMSQNMAMVKFTVSLPVFTGSRQDPQIAAAQAAVLKSEAERAARVADFRREAQSLRAEEAALAAQLARLDTETLPLLDQQVALALAAMRGGGNSAVVLDARKSRLAAQMRGIDLESRLAATRARLHFLAGAQE